MKRNHKKQIDQAAAEIFEAIDNFRDTLRNVELDTSAEITLSTTLYVMSDSLRNAIKTVKEKP